MHRTAFVRWCQPSANGTHIWSAASTADSALLLPAAWAKRASLTSRRRTCGSTPAWERLPPMSPESNRTSRRPRLRARSDCRWPRWRQSCAGSRAEVEDRPARRRRRSGSSDSGPPGDAPDAFPAAWIPAARAPPGNVRGATPAAAPRTLGVASYPHSVYSLGTSHNI
jgi:hypothetical protein